MAPKHSRDEPHSFEMEVDGQKRATRGTPNYVNRIILDDVIDQAMEISTDLELSDIKVPKGLRYQTGTVATYGRRRLGVLRRSHRKINQ